MTFPARRGQAGSSYAAVVRNGYLPGRAIQAGIGSVTVKIPQVRSRTGRSGLPWYRRMCLKLGHWKLLSGVYLKDRSRRRNERSSEETR